MRNDTQHDSFDALTHAQLAQLLELGQTPRWSQADAHAALLHQLRAPLLSDVAAVPGAELPRIELALRQRPGETFLTQLTCDQPAVELLTAIKEFGRHMRAQPATPLVGSPATLLYYAAIAAGLVRLNLTLTSLDTKHLAEGFTWGRQYAPLPELAQLFRQALAKLPTIAGGSS